MQVTDRGPITFLGGHPLRVSDVVAVARANAPVQLAPGALKRIERGRAVVTRALEAGEPIYGVTTGFGALASEVISPEKRAQLQVNLLRSHAAGVGAPLPTEVVRAALLLRAQALAQGYSGVRPVIVERLIDLLNAGIHPVVPEQGSVGASGDLAPLAHLALPLIGEGLVEHQGSVQPAGEALAAAGIEPVTLAEKEALALINGTQIIAALAALATADTARLLRAAEIAAALSFEALNGHTAAFAPVIHQVRPHPGPVAVAARMRVLLERNGVLPPSRADTIQDPYTLRCIPQVIGPVRNALAHVRQGVQIELNAVTDNPLCFPEGDVVLSGGNFHGHPLALQCDYLKTAVASLGAFTERRIARLIDPAASGLPAFLVEEPGINSGFMLAQYTAASLASENKVLAHPASVDSIPTSANVEDYNSMGTIVARNLSRVVANTQSIVAIELLCAAQALDLRKQRPWGNGTTAAYHLLRSRIPFLAQDGPLLHEFIEAATELIRSGELQRVVDEAQSTPHPDNPIELDEGDDA